MWVAEGGLYTFEIQQRGEYFDLYVNYLGSRETYWFHTLNGAKQHVRREYAGLDISRWKKVAE